MGWTLLQICLEKFQFYIICHFVTLQDKHVEGETSSNSSAKEKFLQLSVKDLREIVSARKKVDQRKEGKQDFQTMHQIIN